MDFKRVKYFMEDVVAEGKAPSNAIIIYKDGKEVFRYACGYADVENNISLTGTEHFMIYSCSKIATVTAGLQLLERGKFVLSDPLYAYIPEFKEMYVKDKQGVITKAQNPITIGDLFSMTAGFTYNMNSEGFKRAGEVTGGRYDTVETIRCVASDPLIFEPGSHWGYSIGHDVLAAVISVISGEKFRDYMKQELFDPLGMTQTVYHPTQKIKENMAPQYRYVEDNGKGGHFVNHGLSNHLIPGEEYDSGGAGVITTLDDYIKLIAALANYGKGNNGERILSSNTVDLMRTSRLTQAQVQDFAWKRFQGYGYGLGVRTHMNRALSGVNCSIGEFGWDGAAGALAMIDPEKNLAVFYAQHILEPRQEWYQPRLKNVLYSCLD